MSILNRRAKVKARAVARGQGKSTPTRRRHAVPIEAHEGAVPRERAPKPAAK